MEEQQKDKGTEERVYGQSAEDVAESLEEIIQETIEDFACSMSVVSQDPLSDQEKYILRKRMVKRMRSRLAKQRDEYIDDLEEKNEELMNEVELLSDEGTMDLRQEFEGMKNLVKYLLYRAGYDEEEQIRLPAYQITDMRDVEMRHWWDENDDEVVIELEEFVDET